MCLQAFRYPDGRAGIPEPLASVLLVVAIVVLIARPLTQDCDPAHFGIRG